MSRWRHALHLQFAHNVVIAVVRRECIENLRTDREGQDTSSFKNLLAPLSRRRLLLVHDRYTWDPHILCRIRYRLSQPPICHGGNHTLRFLSGKFKHKSIAGIVLRHYFALGCCCVHLASLQPPLLLRVVRATSLSVTYGPTLFDVG